MMLTEKIKPSSVHFKNKSSRHELEGILKASFDIDKFYDDQWTTIQRLLKGERVLLIEKTGYGKSLCFQFPATIFPGLTVVFSPLIALMRDQVKKLNELGIAAEYINSEQTHEENSQIIRDAKAGRLKILYISPERQENNKWIEATQQMNLSMVVIDEAHCISLWGHDFRPAFRRIINLVKLLPKGLPVLATTATATKQVEEDIAMQIGGDITVLRGKLMRDNLNLFVVKVSSEDEKLIWLGQHLSKLTGTGILYAGTRTDTEVYTKWFEYLKIPTTNYNAGMDHQTRISIEEGMMNNRWKCIISTNALGMGIDKNDIRFIIHTQIPQSPIHYYQEIGRAGRDGKPATVILFYNPADNKLPEHFLDGGRPSIAKYIKVINAVRNELLSEKEIMIKTNLRQVQLKVVKSDLTDQGIVREIIAWKSKKLEYITNAPALDIKIFQDLRNTKKADLRSMLDYVDTEGSRMKFLCDYLGDTTIHKLSNCDNTGLKKLKVTTNDNWDKKLQEFREHYFPCLELESKESKLVDGVAASYYNVSNIGLVIQRCKSESKEDFPNFLLSLTLKAFRKKFRQEKFDLVVYIPSSGTDDLVKNFATKLATVLKFPITHDLIKTRSTLPQRMFNNYYLKSDNVRNVFKLTDSNIVKGKHILLVDDIFDSGATIREVGHLFTSFGATKIAPIVIAKTVTGDII